MSKTRKFSILMLMTLVLMFVASFGTQINANALWNDDFNVSWDNSGNGAANISGTNNMNDSFDTIIEKYKTVITFVSAVGAVTMVAIFIMNFMKLGTTAGNPTERSKCVTALIWSGLAAAGLGSVALIVGIFYGMLK